MGFETPHVNPDRTRPGALKLRQLLQRDIMNEMGFGPTGDNSVDVDTLKRWVAEGHSADFEYGFNVAIGEHPDLLNEYWEDKDSAVKKMIDVLEHLHQHS
jgi:hypothetical protein